MFQLFSTPLRKVFKHHRGFTLSELLVGVTILGLIAAFTIPKVLQGVEDKTKKTNFKEAIATFQRIGVAGWTSGELNPDGSNAVVYFTNNLNVPKICRTNVGTEGCFAQAAPHPEFNTYPGGAVFPNGTTIAFRSTGNGFVDILMDYNGAAGPNTQFGDQIVFMMNISSTTAVHPSYPAYPIRPGEMRLNPDWSGYNTSTSALYDNLWK